MWGFDPEVAALGPGMYRVTPPIVPRQAHCSEQSSSSDARWASEQESECGTAGVRRTEMSEPPFLHLNTSLRASNSI